jgi:hypothetical protein
MCGDPDTSSTIIFSGATVSTLAIPNPELRVLAVIAVERGTRTAIDFDRLFLSILDHEPSKSHTNETKA